MSNGLMQEHTGPVASISAQQLQDGTTLLVSSACDGHLCVWGSSSNSSGGWELLQKITFGIQLQLCADVTYMPGLPGWWSSPHMLSFSREGQHASHCSTSQRPLQTAPAPPHHNILRRLDKHSCLITCGAIRKPIEAAYLRVADALPSCLSQSGETLSQLALPAYRAGCCWPAAA